MDCVLVPLVSGGIGVGVSEVRWEGCAKGGQIGGISGGV
jgi:hypothetical protein